MTGLYIIIVTSSLSAAWGCTLALAICCSIYESMAFPRTRTGILILQYSSMSPSSYVSLVLAFSYESLLSSHGFLGFRTYTCVERGFNPRRMPEPMAPQRGAN